MADKSFILELGKLLIAAAWADGTLSTEEVNGLKELLFQLPDISGEEWMELELYMVSPVTEEERQRLLNRVLQRITSQTDKDLAKDALRKLVLSGSQGADPQIEVVKRLQEDIEQRSTGFLEHLRRPLRRILNLRGQKYSEEHDRESRFEDFIKNTIYFQVTMELRDRGITFDLTGVLLKKWKLTEEQAQLVVEISHHRIFRGLDGVRLVKRFNNFTTLAERKEFVDCLFAVANAAGKTSFDEIEEIRDIAKGLELSHQDLLEKIEPVYDQSEGRIKVVCSE